MSQIEFIYQSIYTTIPCNHNERLKDIIQKYKKKIRKNLKSVYYLYNGNIIQNLESTFDEIANSIDRQSHKMVIQIYEIFFNNKKKDVIKPAIIICPICKMNSRIKINDYKVYFYGCENNHKIDNILFKEFYNFQKIDESKIICNICNTNKKSDSYNRIFYRCNQCKVNICIKCKQNHEKAHNIIEYDKIYYICEEHDDIYTSYCKNCNKNLCISCEEKHDKHEIIYFWKIIYKKENLINRMKELKEEIEKINNDLKDIIYKLLKVMKNLEIY